MQVYRFTHPKHGENHHFLIGDTSWYIFKWLILHCHISFLGCDIPPYHFSGLKWCSNPTASSIPPLCGKMTSLLDYFSLPKERLSKKYVYPEKCPVFEKKTRFKKTHTCWSSLPSSIVGPKPLFPPQSLDPICCQASWFSWVSSSYKASCLGSARMASPSFKA